MGTVVPPVTCLISLMRQLGAISATKVLGDVSTREVRARRRGDAAVVGSSRHRIFSRSLKKLWNSILTCPASAIAILVSFDVVLLVAIIGPLLLSLRLTRVGRAIHHCRTHHESRNVSL
jgi:hypothetical protein